ncbi:von Willebrand factor A domain-containing protein 7-like isoform X2 [Ostrea edulis]|uniref:von Willebrand factor A domain-containing protein 7-like isoform X2 n=1 Tax=Ostrea edulis TaxID=37623 RepID=UPI0024AF053F|nr:von Willebrand factor A domain-containing protein 7-like isoform X2 [Ostrea edulis]
MEQWMIFVVLTTQTLAFLPSQESTNGRPDFTHASITQAGIYYAAADVITNVLSPGKFNASDPDSVIIGFFGQDALIYFANVVVYIVTQNNLAQKTYSEVASRTMNSEQIHAGNIELHNLRKNIIMEAKKASPNWNAKREFVGEYLFTLQEFYSNTNWVEMFRNQSCKELGISGRSLPIPVANGYIVTCVDCDYTVQAIKQLSCAHNIKLDGRVLTSGYTSYQHIPKPLGIHCEHSWHCKRYRFHT